jgi:hypothetical protein
MRLTKIGSVAFFVSHQLVATVVEIGNLVFFFSLHEVSRTYMFSSPFGIK